MEHFFPRIQVQTCAQIHTRVKLLEGMQKKTILKLLGEYSQIIGGEISPHAPCLGHYFRKDEIVTENTAVNI